jgi:hypothetical protein
MRRKRATHVEPYLAGDPEDHEVALGVVLVHLGLVDGADAQLALHRRDQRGALEQRATHQGQAYIARHVSRRSRRKRTGRWRRSRRRRRRRRWIWAWQISLAVSHVAMGPKSESEIEFA